MKLDLKRLLDELPFFDPNEDVRARVTENKQLLLEMAKAGKSKPSRSEKLGRALSSYTNKSTKCYDKAFTEEIRKLRPDWFVNPMTVSADGKKAKLLKMARTGKPRPNKKNELRRFLCNYTCKKTNRCYDEIFDKELRKLRPDWFINQSDIANEKKAKLLGMARAGEPRPTAGKDKLGRELVNYTSKKSDCYDINFDKKIRTLSDWFRKAA